VTNGTDAVRIAREHRPDVAVLDMRLPELNGVEAAREISATAPEVGLVLLSEVAGEQMVRDALRAGVRGFVTKTQGVDILIQAICEVSRGGLYVSPGPTRAVVEACLDGRRSSDVLSPRQREVLRLVAEGNTAKEAAALLHISVRTVDAHRASIMRTLGIHDTPGLVRYAIREGLIVP
jgi:two-component system response regulator NreC